ncbi:hypothetical protein H6P81_006772 [Aristolochia fimbriata]|uniref:Steroid 5-alpha-reductase DET2 n=1 Tax=Aristolochia fimbriata TaxID=158543 RepID=A0AAV7EYL5_ARIFI|nr:hypothetical protein H6P81_006772 [Aristolochia fimbriata]
MASEESFFYLSLLSLYLFAPLTYFPLQFLQAPYGKHFRSGWGPTLPPAVAWALMESPCLIFSLILPPLGRHRAKPLALALIAPYFIHYFHRTLIYPTYLGARRNPAPFPLSIALLAFLFNLLNAYVQIRWLSHYAQYGGAGWQFWARVALGAAVFVAGMLVNIRSDRALIALKKEGGGYKIPGGGLFELVSCPNYFGEVLEWLGWAVMTWSWAGLGFALYTCSNLVPRARANRRWYLEKFPEEYPKSRTAIFPFLY